MCYTSCMTSKRKTSSIRSARRTLHLAERGLGDYQAMMKGPGTYAKRIARRSLTRSLFRLLRS